MEKKTFTECLEKVATDNHYASFLDLLLRNLDSRPYYQEAAELYADQEKKAYALSCIEASLIKAAENAEVDYRGQETQFPIEVIESSITDPSNHVLL